MLTKGNFYKTKGLRGRDILNQVLTSKNNCCSTKKTFLARLAPDQPHA